MSLSVSARRVAKASPARETAGKKAREGRREPVERQELGDIALITALGFGSRRVWQERPGCLPDNGNWVKKWKVPEIGGGATMASIRLSIHYSRGDSVAETRGHARHFLFLPSRSTFLFRLPVQASRWSGWNFRRGTIGERIAPRTRCIRRPDRDSQFSVPHFSSRARAIVLLSSVRLGKFADRSTLMILY